MARVFRFHTEGRRQPLLIGKDASGRKIPGGPYVIWQALALLVPPLMWNTQWLWAGDIGPLPVVICILAVTLAVFYLLGRIDFGRRNPVWFVWALLTAWGGAVRAQSRIGGHPVELRHRQRRVEPLLVEHPVRPTPPAEGQ